MGNKHRWTCWLKLLGLFILSTRPGRGFMSGWRILSWFLNQTLIGRTLLFGSLPLALLGFALWPQDYSPPIFDSQVHYNEESWRLVSTNAILNAAEEINIPWLLVGSTPNEGTLKLYQANQRKVIPMFIPQFTRDDRESWFDNPGILAYMKKEIGRGIYRGIGEFFLFDGQTDTVVVRTMVKLASKHSLVLHARSDPGAIRQLYDMAPGLQILWAHAGMFTPPETVSEMLDRYPGLRVEISHRGDIAPGGKLDDRWRKVFMRHSDRFMLGSGTYTSKYWYQFRHYMSRYRGWLRELPKEVAERIAFRNGLALFNLKQHDSQPERADATDMTRRLGLYQP